nr:unnamed protein product [Callosobruchus analis]
MSNHSEAADSDNLSLCIHCNATFKSKTSLDDHTIREHPGKHPDFIESISSKIHECTHCTYKTTVKGHLTEHMVQHTETADIYKLSLVQNDSANNWKDAPDIQDTKVKLEEDGHYEDFKIEFEEVVIKAESDDLNDSNGEIAVNRSQEILRRQNQRLRADKLMCTACNKQFRHKGKLDDHTIRKHPHLIASVTNKIHECSRCAFKTVIKATLAKHIKKHPKIADSNNLPETVDSHKLSKCIHCNAIYKHKIGLDDHILRQHPELIASVSSKMHECTHCAFKTVLKANLALHMLEHHETADRCKFSTCVHCNTTFIHKQALSDHILTKHPESIGSVSSQIYECTLCAFRTVSKPDLDRHMVKHPETEDRCTFKACVHCNATFKSKTALNDHTLKKHPESIGSVSSKNIYECTQCSFKTVKRSDLARHMLKHPETANQCKFSICVQCKATFKSRPALDDHTLKKHPESIGSVASKNIYECTQCTFKTVKRTDLARHMLKHPEAADRCKFSVCVHCNATFKSKPALVDHTLRKHPDSVGSISIRTYECTHCAYKTCMKRNLSLRIPRQENKHLRADKRKCTVCNKAFRQKGKLDEHTVRKHPHLIASVTNKIHECTRCAFKTVMKASLARHVMKHPEIADSNKLIRCNHCNSTFKSKPALNDHIINRHPDFMASISSKIHQCKYCTYKTTWKSHFARHMLAHPETADSRKLSKYKMHECTHCAFKTVFKDNLTVHMVEHHETADICKFSTCVHCNTTFIDKQALSDHILRKHPGSIGSVSRKYMNVHFVHLKLSQNLIQIVIC